MTTRVNFPMLTLGIIGLGIVYLPDLDTYGAGRAARLDGKARDDLPRGLGEVAKLNWLRGWDVVDYALNHPNPEAL